MYSPQVSKTKRHNQKVELVSNALVSAWFRADRGRVKKRGTVLIGLGGRATGQRGSMNHLEKVFSANARLRHRAKSLRRRR